MLKITIMSLLLGATALVAGLQLFFLPTADRSQFPAIHWDAGTAEVKAGTSTQVNGNLHLQLHDNGMAWVTLPVPELESGSYPFLHLALQDKSKNLEAYIMWSTDEDGQNSHLYKLENQLSTYFYVFL